MGNFCQATSVKCMESSTIHNALISIKCSKTLLRIWIEKNSSWFYRIASEIIFYEVMEILSRCATLANVFVIKDSITTSLTALSKCNGINLYVSRITKDCEYCLVNYYIVENACVPIFKTFCWNKYVKTMCCCTHKSRCGMWKICAREIFHIHIRQDMYNFSRGVHRNDCIICLI